MNISIATVFPDIYKPFLETSIIGRARKQGDYSFDVMSLLSFCDPKERIDAPVFGHGPGMLLRPEVIERAVDSAEKKHGVAFKIFFSPRGAELNQDSLKLIKKRLSSYQHLLLLPARYEGMDERVEQYYADEIISIGNFVLMGGDIPALLFLEGLLRLFPGIVGNQESVTQDSFTDLFVDHPEYTAPVIWKEMEVPPVIRSGNHKEIRAWQDEQVVQKTVVDHFSWLRSKYCPEAKKDLIQAAIPSHYVALLHGDVLLPNGVVGTTSVTSLDIHDIARSAKTYGVEGYFIVTPLEDQKKIVEKLLDFWKIGEGVTYNPHRHEALKTVSIADDIVMVCQKIQQEQGQYPLIIVTSARDMVSDIEKRKLIHYDEQKKVWSMHRPVLILFGTGHGLADSIIKQADFIFSPISGYSHFNHLSVRSAVAVVLDRWLGVQQKGSSLMVEDNKN